MSRVTALALPSLIENIQYKEQYKSGTKCRALIWGSGDLYEAAVIRHHLKQKLLEVKDVKKKSVKKKRC